MVQHAEAIKERETQLQQEAEVYKHCLLFSLAVFSRRRDLSQILTEEWL